MRLEAKAQDDAGSHTALDSACCPGHLPRYLPYPGGCLVSAARRNHHDVHYSQSDPAAGLEPTGASLGPVALGGCFATATPTWSSSGSRQKNRIVSPRGRWRGHGTANARFHPSKPLSVRLLLLLLLLLPTLSRLCSDFHAMCSTGSVERALLCWVVVLARDQAPNRHFFSLARPRCPLCRAEQNPASQASIHGVEVSAEWR